MTYPRTFSHIGITVPNIEKAVEFYTNVLGWYLIMKPTIVEETTETSGGIMCQDVFGAGYGSFKIAHLVAGDRIGIELFEFEKMDKSNAEFKPFKTGLSHFCVQDPNIEELVQKIVASGGKQRMPIREFYPNEKPFKMVYCEDPFGNILEIYSHSYELTFSGSAYK